MFDEAIESLKTSIASFKETLEAIYQTIVQIKELIGGIADILGFIGLRVIILLITNGFILWILNLSSPSTRKTNNFISLGLVIYIACRANMPWDVVIFKYLIIILFPLFIVQFIRGMVLVFRTSYKLVDKKVNKYVAKKTLFIGKLRMPQEPKISVLFSSLLPNKIELIDIKDTIKQKSQILLLDNTGNIVFNNENKLKQFRESFEDKNIDLVWCYGTKYGANEMVKLLERTEKIAQNKYIIGNGDNSFLLNFLQDSWGWKVVFSANYNQRGIPNKKEQYDLKLINNHSFKDEKNWIIKKRIVASDLSVFPIQPVSCDRKILFLSGIVENEILLYRYLIQVEKILHDNKQRPEAIIIGDLNIEVDMAKIIYDFNNELKKNALYIPIFYTTELGFVVSNEKCLIEYKNDEITFKQQI
jgi:muramoyltetrapeptide carboxypeptidase LdcA involved in peptidoglycan recycling